MTRHMHTSSCSECVQLHDGSVIIIITYIDEKKSFNGLFRVKRAVIWLHFIIRKRCHKNIIWKKKKIQVSCIIICVRNRVHIHVKVQRIEGG